jgi:hypothetical protein
MFRERSNEISLDLLDGKLFAAHIVPLVELFLRLMNDLIFALENNREYKKNTWNKFIEEYASDMFCHND